MILQLFGQGNRLSVYAKDDGIIDAVEFRRFVAGMRLADVIDRPFEKCALCQLNGS